MADDVTQDIDDVTQDINSDMPSDMPLYDGAPTEAPDAGAALTTLFASAQEYPHLDQHLDTHLQLAIDPSLGEAADAARAAGAGAEAEGSTTNDTPTGATPGRPGIDPDASGADAVTSGGDAIAADQGAEGGRGTQDVNPDAPPAKRKATSRANMLTRGGACEFCKRRKLKCTAEQPQCQQCKRSGRECVYSQKKQRSRVRVLEDRLQELERRLDDERQANDESPASGQRQAGPESAGTSGPVAVFSAEGVYISPESNVTPSTGVDMFFGLGELGTLSDPFFKRSEPDLMTLADAAAADTDRTVAAAPWEGMTPREVAIELVKAVVENHKGVGEKIMAHLLHHVFAQHPHPRMVHNLVSPSFFFARLSGQTGQPPHPALIAALLPSLMELSPSPTLNNRDALAAVCDAVMEPSRRLSQHALSSLDTRGIDLVAAAALRANALATVGRFVDSFTEVYSAGALAASVGLGKLGGVAEAFLPPDKRPKDRAERMAREQRIRYIRNKSVIVPLPVDANEVAERIKLFWSVYLCDRMNAIGWNIQGVVQYDEITTPLPKDKYDTPEAFADNTTLDDWVSGRSNGSPDESALCSYVKAMTIVYDASRLLDTSPFVATLERSSRLMRAAKRLAATMRPFTPTSPAEAISTSSFNKPWFALYTGMLLLYAKEEIDAPSPSEEAEARNKMIDAGFKMCACIQAAYDAGDTELAGYDIAAPTIWFMTGRAFHHLANRIEGDEPERAAELRRKVTFIVEASKKLSTQLMLAEVHAQMLHNVTLDAEVMLGEYLRPDNVDFSGSL